MPYQYEFSDDFDDAITKIKKKDRLLGERISKKIMEIIENPFHYKPLSNVLKGKRRVHVGHFVIIFEIVKLTVKFIKFEHHDKAYF